MIRYAFASLLLAAGTLACSSSESTSPSSVGAGGGATSAASTASGAGGASSSTASASTSAASSGAGGTGGADACLPVTLGKPLDTDTQAGGSSLVFELLGLEPKEQHLLYVEFFDVAGPQVAGSFDLSKMPEDNYATCAHCVLAFENFSTPSPTKYFVEAGTMSVTAPDTAYAGKSAGTLSSVVLRESTLEKTVTTPVPGGRCLALAPATWDTTN